MPKVAIVIFTTSHGHMEELELAEAVKKGVQAEGGLVVTIYQIPETNAQSNSSYPVFRPMDLAKFDAFIFGISDLPARWKAFWDQVEVDAKDWATDALSGKYAGVFTGSTRTQADGQGADVLSMLERHGILFVNIREAGVSGVSNATRSDANVDSQQPSTSDIELATRQGKHFYATVTSLTTEARDAVKNRKRNPLSKGFDMTIGKLLKGFTPGV